MLDMRSERAVDEHGVAVAVLGTGVWREVEVTRNRSSICSSARETLGDVKESGWMSDETRPEHVAP
jgi:hypothetical protein